MMQSDSTLHTEGLNVKVYQEFSVLWAHAPGYEHPYSWDVRDETTRQLVSWRK